MDNSTSHVLGGIVDRLASVKAGIADLQAEKAQLESVLIESGRLAIDGTQHRVSVVEVMGRKTTDWKSVAEVLKPSQVLVDTYTTVSDGYTIVRVSARRTS